MCGIVAITAPTGSSFRMEAALRAIKHRGPDDQGIFVSDAGDCHLGHVRLSILDLSSAGHQPMVDSTGRFVISYNGEVYNYRELRIDLEKAHGPIPWKSSCDTEVILEGFAREGVSFLSRLNGIFALAIYDQRERRLHVLRDPLGIKPLFCTPQNGSVFFGSELKGLLAIPGLRRTLRRQSLADQLAFMYVPEPHTLFEEFYKLAPGVCETYVEGERVASVGLFTHLHDPLSFSSEQEMVECFRSTFSSAVKRQLVADVPVSLMLSGGVDSSAVAHAAVSHGANLREAYTIVSSEEDSRYDRQGHDLCFAKLMAGRLGISLTAVEPKQDCQTLLPELIPFLEDGISDPASLNTYLICKAARNSGVKVMLTGQGADEYLGGYRRYLAERLVSWMPAPMRRGADLLGRLVPYSIPGRFNAVGRRVKRLLTVASQDRSERLRAMYTWSAPKRILGLFNDAGGLAVADGLSSLFESYSRYDVIDAMMRVDHTFDLMSLNLAYTDRMSMAVGVEARVPFLDLELVRVMNSIPSRVKVKHGTLKYVLKTSMAGCLPREILQREKAGFGLPIRAWMRRDSEMLRHYFNKDRIRRQGIFSPSALHTMCAEQFAGRDDHANVLFSMLCIQIWLETQCSLA